MLPSTSTRNTWIDPFDLPRQMLGLSNKDYDLYQDEDVFVLEVELPGFDPAEIDVRWSEGRLAITAEHDDEKFDRTERYQRTFRFPKEIEDDDIAAEYENGILTVTLPLSEYVMAEGTVIDVKA